MERIDSLDPSSYNPFLLHVHPSMKESPVPDNSKLIEALTLPGNIIFSTNEKNVADLTEQIGSLQTKIIDDATYLFTGDGPSMASTKVKIYPTGHSVFYDSHGRRFLCTDPEGHALHECDWIIDEKSGKPRLHLVRMRLDCQQWVGIKPAAKTFSTQIDIKGLPGWESVTLDDLRKKAAEAWKTPLSEIKYFYKDENFVSQGEGKYDVRLAKDALYVLKDGTFDKTLFISFMCSLDWENLELIPVVELFQSTLSGSGGAVFEFLWGLYEDQSRSSESPLLRYRGLPTYPSEGAFNIFSAFFNPKGPASEKALHVFMNPDRSHEITWTPKADPPWRYFSDEHSICLTVQDSRLYKVTAFDDPVALPYINASGKKHVPCRRELAVVDNKIVLSDEEEIREIPLSPAWGIKAEESTPGTKPDYPFGWRKFFDGELPQADPVKALFTVPFYPEGNAEIEESSLQPMALDQILLYMEGHAGMEDLLIKTNKTLIHTFDTVIAGCVDCNVKREYTVLYNDIEFARKNAQILWDYSASLNQLENVADVHFLPEEKHVNEVYNQKFDMIFKWIPFLYHTDRETCEAILKSLSEALVPGGILFLQGPRPLKGLFEHYRLTSIKEDPIIDMPFFRQHFKMCPDNKINPDITIFFAKKNE